MVIIKLGKLMNLVMNLIMNLIMTLIYGEFTNYRLSPLMTIDDNPDDYLEALTHEMLHDNLGPPGFFDSDVHRYPG